MQDLVLIFSQDFEVTTDVVLQWLDYYNQKFYRVNTEDHVTCKKLQVTEEGLEFELIINEKDLIQSSYIKSFWYRRGNLKLDRPRKEMTKNAFPSKKISDNVHKHLCRELGAIDTIIYDNLENRINSFGKASNSVNNKLVHFQIAQSLGIDVPNSYVCTQKCDVVQLLKDNEETTFVVKAISDGAFFEVKEKGYSTSYALYTELFERSQVDELPNEFFPSLLQEKLDKRYELRIFYLAGEFFSMAIFSQGDPQTQVDFRKYNYQKPNRNVPYKLPDKISGLLSNLMELLNLNTGSIDMVVTPDLKYYFLEVNPVGQFGMVSYPCNYNLERKVARLLSAL